MSLSQNELLKMAQVVKAASETNALLEQEKQELQQKVAELEQEKRFSKIAQRLIEKDLNDEQSAEEIVSWLQKVASREDGEVEIRSIERSIERDVSTVLGKVASESNASEYGLNQEETKTASSLEKYLLGLS